MLGFLKKLLGTKDESQLLSILKNGAFLVDVRSESEFESGSVKGAVNIPVNSIAKHLSKFKNKKNIVVFCRSGMRSAQAKIVLNQNGIHNVSNGGTWLKVQQHLNNELK